jgi:hypothetical protein
MNLISIDSLRCGHSKNIFSVLPGLSGAWENQIISFLSKFGFFKFLGKVRENFFTTLINEIKVGHISFSVNQFLTPNIFLESSQ